MSTMNVGGITLLREGRRVIFPFGEGTLLVHRHNRRFPLRIELDSEEEATNVSSSTIDLMQDHAEAEEPFPDEYKVIESSHPIQV